MTKALVLFSGGMDSTVALTAAVRARKPSDVLALSFKYGSLHNDAESEAAERIAEFLGVERQVIELPPSIFTGGNSALLGESEMPDEEYHDPKEQSPSATVVPGRNAVLLAIAASRAEALGYVDVIAAPHMNDAVGYAYPDCTPQFLSPLTEAIRVSSMGKVVLVFPYTHNTKSHLVEIGASVRAPLNMSWSCYRGDYEKGHCGSCPTCKERLVAFHDAGYMDPAPHKTSPYDGPNAITGLAGFPPGERSWNV